MVCTLCFAQRGHFKSAAMDWTEMTENLLFLIRNSKTYFNMCWSSWYELFPFFRFSTLCLTLHHQVIWLNTLRNNSAWKSTRTTDMSRCYFEFNPSNTTCQNCSNYICHSVANHSCLLLVLFTVALLTEPAALAHNTEIGVCDWLSEGDNEMVWFIKLPSNKYRVHRNFI